MSNHTKINMFFLEGNWRGSKYLEYRNWESDRVFLKLKQKQKEADKHESCNQLSHTIHNEEDPGSNRSFWNVRTEKGSWGLVSFAWHLSHQHPEGPAGHASNPFLWKENARSSLPLFLTPFLSNFVTPVPAMEHVDLLEQRKCLGYTQCPPRVWNKKPGTPTVARAVNELRDLGFGV